MKKTGIYVIFLNLIFILFMCSCHSEMVWRSVFVMDSVADIRVYSENEKTAEKICNSLYELDECFSAYDGEVLRLNESAGGEMSYHVHKALVQSLELGKKTGGTSSPILGEIIELWGIGSKNYVPTEEEIKNALDSARWDNISIDGYTLVLKNGAKLNFGAFAKGYASDVISEIFVADGVRGAVVSLGGNVYVHGKKTDGKPWSVAIRDPQGSTNDWLGAIELSDKFVISSGDYERYFEKDGKRYHHIINPKTGKPAESDLVSCSVICESGIMGDAYSTALYIMGREDALEFWRENGGFELVLVGRDGKVTVTEGIAGVFAPNDKGRYSYETAYR